MGSVGFPDSNSQLYQLRRGDGGQKSGQWRATPGISGSTSSVPETAQIHNVSICRSCDPPICRRWPVVPRGEGKQSTPESGREAEGDDCRRGREDWRDDAFAEESATGGHFNVTGVNRPSGIDSECLLGDNTLYR